MISQGDTFVTSKNLEACCYFLVGFGWFLLFPGEAYSCGDNIFPFCDIWSDHFWMCGGAGGCFNFHFGKGGGLPPGPLPPLPPRSKSRKNQSSGHIFSFFQFFSPLAHL